MKHDTGELIGTGGMGEVYRAWDPDLERPVALKYLRHASGEMVERLLREARAQARINHPSICEVYEVGEDNGVPFIAMQFVEGELLSAAAEKMSLEQKVLVVNKVAEAVQAAHSEGLIHRDLKPGNIIVAQGEQGEIHPYVLDFGIAREKTVPGLTVTGQVLGTPGYLSPEQARGDAALDRRTDIFSLGIVLYELCSGARPFSGDSDVELLVSLLSDEPTPLRQIVHELPRDLETVIMRCLEKEPGRRYASAKELAEDLRSFLDGEPVAARPVGSFERLRRRVLKHPLVAALSMLSIVAIISLSAIAIHSRWSAGRRAEAAQRLGQEAERLASTMRIAHLTPLHDLGPEKQLVGSRLDWIQREVDRLGRSARGPGLYALGLGQLALGRPKAAREHLEAAWADGYETPEVAHALGEAFGALYLTELEVAQRSRNAEQRQTQVEEIQEELREPALEYLNKGAGARQRSPEYVEATIAFYEERYDDAIARSREAAAQNPWLYEAKVLEGRAIYQQGMAHVWAGRYDDARETYARARETIAAAVEIGRSDPTTHEAQCVSWHLVLEADRAEGRSIQHAYEQILESCGRALEADPERSTAHEKIARAHWRWAEVLRGQGADPTSTLDKVVTSARAAVSTDPTCFRASNIEGLAWWRRALFENQTGRDPRDSLTQGVEALERTLGINPNYRHAHNNLALIHNAWARYAESIGLDSAESYEKAVKGFEGAIKVDPDYIYAYNNLAVALTNLGEAEQVAWGNAEPYFARAAASAREALKRNPNYANALNSLAQALVRHAEFQLERGSGPVSELLTEADQTVSRAFEINPSRAEYLTTLAHSRYLSAKGIMAGDGDPTEQISEALNILEEGLNINPSLYGAKHQIGSLHLLAADHAVHAGADPSAHLRKSQRAYDDARAENPNDVGAVIGVARLALLEGRWRARTGRDPRRAFERALEATHQASGGDPHPTTLLIDARVHLERARWMNNRDEPTAPTLESALDAVIQVRDMIPNHPEADLLEAEITLERCRQPEELSEDCERLVRHAITCAERSLDTRKNHPQTRVVLENLKALLIGSGAE